MSALDRARSDARRAAPRHDGGDAGRGRRLPRVHLGGDLLPVGQPPPLLLLEIQRAGPQGPHAQGRTDRRTRTDGRTIQIRFLIGAKAISSSGALRGLKSRK